MRYRVGILAFVFTAVFPPLAKAQTQIFIPLKFAYPDSILLTPKTYVYKNADNDALRYRDVILKKQDKDVIISWKEYDKSHLADSSTEINGKSSDHYMIMNGKAIKAVITEDSIYPNGTRFGEKVQTLFFNLSSTISLFQSVHYFFLKDTTINWHDKPVQSLVIQSFYRQKLSNSLFPDQPKEITGMIYYYFGKDIGLLMYRSEIENEKLTWQLVDIKESKVE